MSKKKQKKADFLEENDDLLGEAAEKGGSPIPKKKNFMGQDVRILQDGAEFLGRCVAERGTPSGDQLFLQLNGCVSRWFSVSNIIG